MFDTGDALVGGGALGDDTQGEVIIAGMNLMQYDAMALGPEELSLGPEVLGQRMKEARFAILSANVRDAATGRLFASPYVVLDVRGHKVGVIGLTRVVTEEMPAFKLTDPLEALNGVLSEVDRQADTVIVLTNLEYDSAMSLGSSVRGIDLIIAARPNRFPAGAGHSPVTGTLVLTAEQPLSKHTGRWVGRLSVTLAVDGSLVNPTWQAVPMSQEFADDPDMTRLLDGFRK